MRHNCANSDYLKMMTWIQTANVHGNSAGQSWQLPLSFLICNGCSECLVQDITGLNSDEMYPKDDVLNTETGTLFKWRRLVSLCSSYSWHVMVLSASSECQPIEMPVLWEAPGAGMHGQWEETSCEGKLDVMSRKSRRKKQIQSISTGMFEMGSAWPRLCPSYTV